MKKILCVLSSVVSVVLFSQINIQTTPNQTIPGESAFLDASGYVSFPNNVGKGLVFPRVDLTTFTFVTTTTTPAKFRTAYDGMVVYNTGTGSTLDTPATAGIQTTVSPGFYYFYNPTGATTRNVTAGKWVRIGEAAASTLKAADYTSTAVLTGENFYTDASTAKPVYRQMVPVTFNSATYAKLNASEFTANTVFIKTTLVDPATGKVVLNSTEYRPNETVNGVLGNYIFAAYGNIYTTLNGTYNLIVEYYTK
ncbi:hypothetical protein [Bergeyella sp. RCAD1439]|uniref:hypothetical protein n=1 Tax=Bergeyella anatis TaxID=3113737 RepID=UPI002E17BB56|nr:hypothetical protein [Bergeyella sp. RCAD1439]